MTVLYFAQLDTLHVVTSVLVVESADVEDKPFPDSEPLGVAYLNRVLGPGSFVQTSHEGTYRRRFAGPGMAFDFGRDAFIQPQPYPSWWLDDNCDWQPPTPKPDDPTKHWVWDETLQEWIGFDKPPKPPIETLGE